MDASQPRARHRAPDPADTPTNTGPLHRAPLQVRTGPIHRRSAMSLATGGLMVLTTLTAPPAPAEAPVEQTVSVETATLDVVTADATATLTREKVSVTTTPAPPPPPAPEPVVEAAPEPEPPAVRTPTPAPAPVARHVAPAPVAAPAPAGTKASLIASAALGQLGWAQDCTRLVSNALLAVGITFHDWPAGYLSLGAQVTAAQAVPGDLLYYANGGMGVAHIAVYIGNGMAVHGGWNGNRTVTFSANVGSGPVYIRVA